MRVWSTIVIAVIAFSSPFGAASAVDSATYEVSTTLSHAGKPFATPSAIVQVGQPATLEVSGAEGYKLTLVVTDLESDRIQVAARLDSSHGAMEPTVVVRPDESATVSTGDVDLELTVSRIGG